LLCKWSYGIPGLKKNQQKKKKQQTVPQKQPGIITREWFEEEGGNANTFVEELHILKPRERGHKIRLEAGIAPHLRPVARLSGQTRT